MDIVETAAAKVDLVRHTAKTLKKEKCLSRSESNH